MNRALLAEQLAALPLLEYEFFPTERLPFSERIRYVCRTQCPMYGKSWACPPAVGAVADCERRCRSFSEGLVLSTVAEVADITDLSQTLATRAEHEAITREAAALLRAQVGEVYVLSTEACAHCAQCSYPDAPCRFPELMYPCVESHGIIVSELAERLGMSYENGANVVTWFSVLLFRDT